MSSAHILSTFQSTFPGLYKPFTESENDEHKREAGAFVVAENAENDPYHARIAGITSKFERLRASADEMEQYLRTAAEEAKEAEGRALAKADEEFTPAWRSVGLPLKPSHLHLDQGAMTGARLVNPKAIVKEYQAIKGREVLNPPRVAEYADTSAEPNYLKVTQVLDIRKTRTLSPERLESVKQISGKALTWHTLTAEEVAAKIHESEERRRQLSLKMPRSQFEKEHKIIQAMHHKLTFLRNPRHPLPPAVRNLLDLKPNTRGWAGPRSEYRVGVAPPIKSNMTAREDVIFVIEPSEVTFTNYVVGRTYEKLVRVRNMTSVSRALRVFPPASQYFHVSLPRFPGPEGLLAPGIAAELTLRFCPDSLGDYEDSIAVDTTLHRLTVPLRARRPPPSLTLPEEFDMGQVVIGNIKTEQISFINLGGQGCFRIVPEADWPDFAQDAPTDRAVVGPFKIWPLYFEMESNEEIAINVSYEPTDWGSNDERLVLVCDNCQVKTFTLLGNGVSVDVMLHSVDGRMLEPRELDLPLWFGEVAPRSAFAKTVSVRNTTKLPFAFEWSLTKYPQVQNKRRANEPLQTEHQYDEEQDGDGHVLLVDNKALRGGASPRRGMLDDSAQPQLPQQLQQSQSQSLLRQLSKGSRSAGSGSAAAAVTAATAAPAALGAAPSPGAQSVSPTRPLLLPGAEAAGTPWGIISGRGAHGPDPLALSAVTERVFSVTPERGVLQPGEIMEFQFTFTPPGCHRYERWAQLRVDRTPFAGPVDGGHSSGGRARGLGGLSGGVSNGPPLSHAALAAAAQCDVLVAEVGLEGLGCLVQLEAVPRLLAIPGTLMPQQKATRRVTLRNPTRGPVDVRVTADDPSISVHPPTLSVPGLGSASINVTLTAPELQKPGSLRCRLVVAVEHGHGPSLPLEVRATLGVTHASLTSSRLDFGLVRLNATGERTLVVRNCSATSSTPWSLRELSPAVIAAEKVKLLRSQLLRSSRMLDPVAAAAAIAALRAEEEAEEAEEAAREAAQRHSSQPQHHSSPTSSKRPSAGVQDVQAGPNPSNYRRTDQSATGYVPPGPVHTYPQASVEERRAMLTAARTATASSESESVLSAAPLFPPACTHLTFEPSSGELGPGQELAVRVTVHGRSDGRSRSIVQLQSGVGLGHLECIEAFVCVVTPRCVIDLPVVDLGVTFVGVQVREFLSMRNLSLLPLEFRWSSESADGAEGALADLRVKPEKGQLAPGEEVELQIRYTPRATGQSVMYGVCELDGAPYPLGFRVTSSIHGLDVTFDLLTQEEYDEMGVAAGQVPPTPNAAAATHSAPPKPTLAPAAAVAGVLSGIGVETSALSVVSGGGGAYYPRPSPPVMSLFRHSRNGRPELDVSLFQALPNVPPEILARIASEVPTTMTSAAASGAGDLDKCHVQQRRPFRESGGSNVVRPLAAAAVWPPPTSQRHLIADYGKAVPLGETRLMYLVLTNRTAMHTSVRTWLDRFGVEDASRFQKTRSSVKSDGGGRSDRRQRESSHMSTTDIEGPRIRTSKYTPVKLTNEVEKRAPFKSAKGNEMMANRRLQQEAEQALGSKGLAVSVLPPETTLSPWSSKVLAISCFNDMCGAYMDMLHVKVGDLAPLDIPVLLGVAGTPLVVQRERVLVRGLRDKTGWRTSLAWGHMPLGVEQKKTFYVFNTGSLDMQLTWEMRRFREYIDLDALPPTTDVGIGGTGVHDSLYGGGPGLLRDTRVQHKLFDVTLSPDERHCAVRVTATRRADTVPLDQGPFLIEPKEQVIRGGGSAAFTVSFVSSEPRGHAGYLHGACRVHSDTDSPVKLLLWPSGEAAEGVGAMLSGTFHPHAGAPPTPLLPLRVDLSASSLPSRLEPDGQDELSWSVASIHQPASHPSFVHSVTLSNTRECPQVFSLDVSGPWDLVAAAPSVPQDPIIYKGTSTLLGQAEATGKLGKSALEGGQIFLPPRESVDVTLRYVPGKGDLETLPVRFAAMQARQRIVETTADFKSSGELSISFANGDSQSLPLLAEMLHPRLEVRPRRLNFGRVHLQSPKELRVELYNPTNVDAAWAVTVEGIKPRFPTLPGAGAAASATAQAEAAAAASGGGAQLPAARSAHSSTAGGPADGTSQQSRASSQASGSRAVTGNVIDTTAVAVAAASETLAADRMVTTGGVPPPLPKPSVPGSLSGITGIIAEARIGPYVVRPASGVLPGRGLRLPHTQTISILFAPTEPQSYDGELIFAVLRGKECSVEIDGIGSVEETDEHQGKLLVI